MRATCRCAATGDRHLHRVVAAHLHVFALSPERSPDELLGPVMRRDLRGGTLDADLRAEVDAQLVGGLARFGVGLGLDDGSCADVDPVEIRVGDFRLAIDGRHDQAFPRVSKSTLASASLAGVPDQTTNWNA